jgi:hypothetical protein
MAGKTLKDRLAVSLCVNSDGSDKLVPIVIGKSPKPRCFKNIKRLPTKYHTNNKAWMTTNIFSSFLRSLDASMVAKNRNILLFVDNCAVHPKDTLFLRNVKVIRYLENCTSVLQPLDLGVIKCYKQLYKKHLMQTAVYLMDAGKDTKKKMNMLEALHYTVAALQQITQQTIENCFRKAGYVQGQSSGDSDVVLTNDDYFRQDWEKFGGMNKDKFEDYVSVDSHDNLWCRNIAGAVQEPRGVRECGGGRRKRRRRRWRTRSCAELC